MKNFDLFKNVFNKRSIILVLMSLTINYQVFAQEKEYIKNATIEEQINFVTEKSTSWENHKVILTSWMSSMKRNVLDTLKLYRNDIDTQKNLLSDKEDETIKLQKSLDETTELLNLVQTEKDTFEFLGFKLSKGFFISMVIIIFLALIASVATIFTLYKRSFDTIRKTREELDTTNKEFENYRQESRKKHEHLVVQHHREIQKLKGL